MIASYAQRQRLGFDVCREMSGGRASGKGSGR